jgi:hypothetical protein
LVTNIFLRDEVSFRSVKLLTAERSIDVAKQQTSQGAADFVAAYKSFFFDLPMARLQQSFGMNTEKEATEAAWTGYDAAVRMLTSAVDSLYRSPVFSDLVSRTLNTTLRWQQISGAVSGAIFTSFWTAVGAPTAAEVQGLSEQLRSLEQRLSQLPQKKDVQNILDQIRTLDARLHRTTPTAASLRNNHHEERAAA